MSGWNVRFDVDYVCDRSRSVREKFSAVRNQPCERGEYAMCRAHCCRPAAVVEGRYRERSYKLDAVAEKHLGAAKAPVKYSEMRALQTPAGRARMGTYCAKTPIWCSALRPHGRVAGAASAGQGVPVAAAAGPRSRQQAKVLSLLSAKCRHFEQGTPYQTSSRATEPRRYRRAYDPIVGLHDKPVAVLDFESSTRR